MGSAGSSDHVVPVDREEPDVNGGLKIVTYGGEGGGACGKRQEYGWHPVNVVNRQAWREIEKAVADSRARISAGSVSCLHYYMVINQMTPLLLACYAGLPLWRVLLHLRPFFFRRLGDKTLHVYGELFKVSADDLRRGVLKEAIYERC